MAKMRDFVCMICSDEYSKLTAVDGMLLCDECYDRYVFYCDDCGESAIIKYRIETPFDNLLTGTKMAVKRFNGKNLCHACFADGLWHMRNFVSARRRIPEIPIPKGTHRPRHHIPQLVGDDMVNKAKHVRKKKGLGKIARKAIEDNDWPGAPVKDGFRHP